MAVELVTSLLERTVIGQYLVSLIGWNSPSIHLPAASTVWVFQRLNHYDAVWAVCLIVRLNDGVGRVGWGDGGGRGVTSCRSVGQVQFGSWGMRVGWGPARMSVWWQGCTPPLGLRLHAIIFLIPSVLWSAAQIVQSDGFTLLPEHPVIYNPTPPSHRKRTGHYNPGFQSRIGVITVLWHPLAWHHTSSGQLNSQTPPSPPSLIALLMESLAPWISLSDP